MCVLRKDTWQNQHTLTGSASEFIKYHFYFFLLMEAHIKLPLTCLRLKRKGKYAISLREPSKILHILTKHNYPYRLPDCQFNLCVFVWAQISWLCVYMWCPQPLWFLHSFFPIFHRIPRISSNVCLWISASV